MPNNYFAFKEFTVYQDKCAMKVCTDACLFGAWVANSILKMQPAVKSILDIGTGTGLLSLMVAQKVQGSIDAVEINKDAFVQATSNIEQSLWKKNISVFNADIQFFNFTKKYDCIISNPPFFENDLVSPDKNKNDAKHDVSLTLSTLARIAAEHLHDTGILFVLLPWQRADYFKKEAFKHEFYPLEKISVRQTPEHNFFRSMTSFSRQEMQPVIHELSIKNTDGNYSDEFNLLLKDYYLNI